MKIFTPTDEDRSWFAHHLDDFLPEHIFDFHSHLVLPGTVSPITPERLKRYWVLRVPAEQTAEEYLESYQSLLPGRRVESVAFGMPILEVNIAAANEGVMAASRAHPEIHPFCLVHPQDTEESLERLAELGFEGFKPYPDFVTSDHPGEERIEEFLTPAMCRVADRRGLPVTLHISRGRRYADPRNIEDLLALSEKYPRMKLIVAHLGRSFNPHYLERALEQLGGAPPWWHDFSAVTNPETHALALRELPHDKICFGLDNPIMLSRGYYEFPSPETYTARIAGLNLEDGGCLPPLAWQIMLGFRQAAEKTKLSPESKDLIFYRNAKHLLRRQ